MAENQDTKKTDEKACCGTGRHCCGTKGLLVLVLVLLAGVIGYLMGSHGMCGRHGWMHHGCGYPMSMMAPAPGQAPSK